MVMQVDHKIKRVANLAVINRKITGTNRNKNMKKCILTIVDPHELYKFATSG
jgi:hypothetical protein